MFSVQGGHSLRVLHPPIHHPLLVLVYFYHLQFHQRPVFHLLHLPTVTVSVQSLSVTQNYRWHAVGSETMVQPRQACTDADCVQTDVLSYLLRFQSREHQEQERHLLPRARAQLCSRQPCVVLHHAHHSWCHDQDVDSNSARPGDPGGPPACSADIRLMGGRHGSACNGSPFVSWCSKLHPALACIVNTCDQRLWQCIWAWGLFAVLVKWPLAFCEEGWLLNQLQCGL